MSRVQKQTYLPGTEPADDPNIEEINVALDEWNGAKDAQRTAADTTKIRHASLLETMLEHGLDRYPYLDAVTGKKKHVVIKRDPRAVSANAPRVRRDVADEPGVAVEPREDREVEVRKVPRAEAEKEIWRPSTPARNAPEQEPEREDSSDPFAATREAFGKLRDAVEAEAAAVAPPAKRKRAKR